MAALALNTFKTIRHIVSPNNVGIYTAPLGVASIILLAQATNIRNDEELEFVTISHFRDNRIDSGMFPLVYNTPLIPRDPLKVCEGKLVLETDDSLYVQGSSFGGSEVVFSILETAKS